MSLILILLLLPACGGTSETTVTKTVTVTSTSTSTGTSAPTVKIQEPIVKVLNPVGTYIPVETKPLAPRLNSLAGKNIWYYQSEANPVIMPVLLNHLKKDYPTTTWKFYETQGWGTDAVTADELKGVDAVIRGVGW
jgi:hypothetical protein